MNLNLGCGTSRIQDHINIDFTGECTDLLHDLRTPLPYADESVDRIYSSHCIEHFARHEWEDIRQDWIRVIKPGGEIELRCPDIWKVATKYLRDPTDSFTMKQLYGLQNHEGEYHKNGFTVQSLTNDFPDFTAEVLEPSTDTELHMKFTKGGNDE